jgi:hypothetical protein
MNFEMAASLSVPEPVAGIETLGTYAYLPAGKAGLFIIDISNSAMPRIAAQVDTPGNAKAVAVEGNFAYVADEIGGLQVIDVADPAAASVVGAVEGTGSFIKLAIAGLHVYAADTSGALQTIDISSPRDPKPISSLNVSGKKSICGLAIEFPYVYLTYGYLGMYGALDAGKGELSIIDVSDPLSPRRLGSAKTRHIGHDIEFAGQYVYIACTDLNGGGLELLDVSDPSVPRSSGYVCFPDNPSTSNLELKGKLAFVAARKMLVVDVSDPKLPYLIDAKVLPASAIDIAFSDPLICLACQEQKCQPKCRSVGKFQIFKPSTETVLPVSSIATPETEPASLQNVQYMNTSSAVAVEESIICSATGSANGSKVQVLDISKRPPVIGCCSLTGEAKDIAIYQNFALIASGALTVIDMSNPQQPAVVGSVEGITGACAVEISDKYAYVLNGAKLFIVDIRQPAKPVIASSIEIPYSARDVALSKKFAFIANGAGLQIVNVSRKNAPKLAGSVLYEWAMANRIAAKGNHVYLGDNGGYVTIVDVKNPSAPVILGTKKIAGPPGAMAISGNTLFVPVSTDSIIMESVDIADPANPRAATKWGKDGSGFQGGATAISESKVYVTDLNQGLWVGPTPGSLQKSTFLKITPEELSASYEIGLDAEPLKLEVVNAGSGSLRYSISSDAEWLDPWPCVGDLQENEATVIEAKVSRERLYEGKHVAKIMVADSTGGRPRIIPVTLEVQPSKYPSIKFEPSSLNLKDARPGRVEKITLTSEGPFRVLEATTPYPGLHVEIDSEESSLQHILTVTINERGKPDKKHGAISVSTDNPLYKKCYYPLSISFGE